MKTSKYILTAFLSLSAATLLQMTALQSAASAEEQKVEAKKESSVHVDGQTGSVHQHQKTATETEKANTAGGAATLETERTDTNSVSAQGATGQKTEAQTAQKSKSSVTAHPDGDVSATQKTEAATSHKTE